MALIGRFRKIPLGGKTRRIFYCASLRRNKDICASTEISDKKNIPRMKQMSVDWMTNLSFKFFGAEVFMLNTNAGSLATTKSCLQLPEHHRFSVVTRRPFVCRMWGYRM